MMKKIIESIKFNESGMLALALGFVGAIVMMTLQMFNITPQRLISPLINSGQAESVKEKILPKLSKFKSVYMLHSNNSIIAKADAQSNYDQASAYIATDYETGKVLLSKNINTRLPIASLTKIMTAVVALDLASPDQLFTVTKNAQSKQPTKIGVIEGQKMSVEELLNATLLTSANDAAQVINDGIDNIYGEGAFIAAMNEKAKLIGLTDSHFANPQGFDSNENFSTVADLALLAHYALTNYPNIKDIVKKDYEFLPANKNHKQFDLYNWNGLVGVYPGVIGFKIGNTDLAHYTTVVVSERDGKKIIAVVLGAPDIYERDFWAASILDAGYQMEKGLPPINITMDDLSKKYSTWKSFN